jgi:thioredoxin domain-containing protein 5
MRSFHKISRLPLSLLVISLGFLAAALPILANELTPDNFDSSTASGLWFIEFYSPSCGHCRAFAPTWKQLVEQAATETPGVKLAQVNCLAYGGTVCIRTDCLSYY